MLWQDWILTAGSLIFTIALIPSILGKDKPALSSSLLTGTVLLVFAFVYGTLGLWFSVFSTTLTALAWFTLAIQKAAQTKKQA